MPPGTPFRVGGWRVEPRGFRISRDGVVRELTPRIMRLLEELADRAGEVVPRDDLVEAIWPDSYVGEESLTQAVSELRRLLDDDSREPHLVRTVRNVGYELIAEVERGPAPVPEGGAPIESVPPAAATDAPAGLALSRAIPTFAAVALVVALALLLGSWSVRTIRTDPGDPAAPRPLTSYPGYEFDPAVSPDGTQLAFAWSGEDGNYDLYVRRLDAETPLRITSHPGPGFDGSPAWSPQGDALAFLRSSDERCSLLVKPMPSGDEELLAPCHEHFERALAWSPDGDWIAFADRESPDVPARIYLISTSTRRVRPLTAPPAGQFGDLYPAFSPDGRTLAFVRGQVEGPLVRTASPVIGDLFVIDLATGEEGRLTHDAQEIPGLAFAADGRGIVFASNRAGGRFALWHLDLASGETRTLLRMEGVLANPTATASGIAFQITRDQTDIWRLELDPASGEPLGEPQRFLSSTRRDMAPAFSPDGGSIAFGSGRSGAPEIWVADADGARPTRRTRFEGSHVGGPQWSPDGRFLTFEAYADGNSEIYTLPLAGGEPRRLTHHPAPDLAPAFTGDGRGIVFGSTRSGSWQLWQVPLRGGQPVRLTSSGGLAARAARVGGRSDTYFVRADRSGLWRLGADGAPESVLHEVRLWTKDWGSWSIVGDVVYFLTHQDRQRAQWRSVDLVRGTNRLLLELDQDAVWGRPGLTVSPDGRWLLFTRLTDVGGDLMQMAASDD